MKPGLVSSSAESLFQQALAMHSAGQFSKAEILYRKSIKADFEQPGDEDVLRKVFGDLKGAGVATSERDVRMKMNELLAVARGQMDAEA